MDPKARLSPSPPPPPQVGIQRRRRSGSSTSSHRYDLVLPRGTAATTTTIRKSFDSSSSSMPSARKGEASSCSSNSSVAASAAPPPPRYRYPEALITGGSSPISSLSGVGRTRQAAAAVPVLTNSPVAASPLVSGGFRHGDSSSSSSDQGSLARQRRLDGKRKESSLSAGRDSTTLPPLGNWSKSSGLGSSRRTSSLSTVDGLLSGNMAPSVIPASTHSISAPNSFTVCRHEEDSDFYKTISTSMTARRFSSGSSSDNLSPLVSHAHHVSRRQAADNPVTIVAAAPDSSKDRARGMSPQQQQHQQQQEEGVVPSSERASISASSRFAKFSEDVRSPASIITADGVVEGRVQQDSGVGEGQGSSSSSSQSTQQNPPRKLSPKSKLYRLLRITRRSELIVSCGLLGPEPGLGVRDYSVGQRLGLGMRLGLG